MVTSFPLSVRPEFIEGRIPPAWFDKLTTSGLWSPLAPPLDARRHGQDGQEGKRAVGWCHSDEWSEEESKAVY